MLSDITIKMSECFQDRNNLKRQRSSLLIPGLTFETEMQNLSLSLVFETGIKTLRC